MLKDTPELFERIEDRTENGEVYEVYRVSAEGHRRVKQLKSNKPSSWAVKDSSGKVIGEFKLGREAEAASKKHLEATLDEFASIVFPDGFHWKQSFQPEFLQ